MNIEQIYSPAYSFADNWKFQKYYYSQIKAIIKNNAFHFISIEIADDESDMKRATDFIVKIVGGDIAVRIRRPKQNYRDLTIRSRNNRHKTEIDKLREGFGKFYLYCWTNVKNEISEWMLINLDRLRLLKVMDNRSDIPNGDGTWFIAIPRNELRDLGCIVAESTVP